MSCATRQRPLSLLLDRGCVILKTHLLCVLLKVVHAFRALLVPSRRQEVAATPEIPASPATEVLPPVLHEARAEGVPVPRGKRLALLHAATTEMDTTVVTRQGATNAPSTLPSAVARATGRAPKTPTTVALAPALGLAVPATLRASVPAVDVARLATLLTGMTMAAPAATSRLRARPRVAGTRLGAPTTTLTAIATIAEAPETPATAKTPAVPTRDVGLGPVAEKVGAEAPSLATGEAATPQAALAVEGAPHSPTTRPTVPTTEVLVRRAPVHVPRRARPTARPVPDEAHAVRPSQVPQVGVLVGPRRPVRPTGPTTLARPASPVALVPPTLGGPIHAMGIPALPVTEAEGTPRRPRRGPSDGLHIPGLVPSQGTKEVRSPTLRPILGGPRPPTTATTLVAPKAPPTKATLVRVATGHVLPSPVPGTRPVATAGLLPRPLVVPVAEVVLGAVVASLPATPTFLAPATY